MDNEINTPTPEQENPVPEEEITADQPGWFQEVVDHYDVDKPQLGDMLKGTILDIEESSILLDVGFKGMRSSPDRIWRKSILKSRKTFRLEMRFLSAFFVLHKVMKNCWCRFKEDWRTKPG